MQLMGTPHCGRDQAARRLSNALRIESYFRRLVSADDRDEVLRQWNASLHLVARALEDYAALSPDRAG